MIDTPLQRALKISDTFELAEQDFGTRGEDPRREGQAVRSGIKGTALRLVHRLGVKPDFLVKPRGTSVLRNRQIRQQPRNGAEELAGGRASTAAVITGRGAFGGRQRPRPGVTRGGNHRAPGSRVFRGLTASAPCDDPSGLSDAECLSCHDLKTDVAKNRSAYWHCHSDLYPHDGKRHRLDRLAQTFICTCHGDQGNRTAAVRI